MPRPSRYSTPSSDTAMPATAGAPTGWRNTTPLMMRPSIGISAQITPMLVALVLYAA